MPSSCIKSMNLNFSIQGQIFFSHVLHCISSLTSCTLLWFTFLLFWLNSIPWSLTANLSFTTVPWIPHYISGMVSSLQRGWLRWQSKGWKVKTQQLHLNIGQFPIPSPCWCYLASCRKNWQLIQFPRWETQTVCGLKPYCEWAKSIMFIQSLIFCYLKSGISKWRWENVIYVCYKSLKMFYSARLLLPLLKKWWLFQSVRQLLKWHQPQEHSLWIFPLWYFAPGSALSSWNSYPTCCAETLCKAAIKIFAHKHTE